VRASLTCSSRVVSGDLWTLTFCVGFRSLRNTEHSVPFRHPRIVLNGQSALAGQVSANDYFRDRGQPIKPPNPISRTFCMSQGFDQTDSRPQSFWGQTWAPGWPAAGTKRRQPAQCVAAQMPRRMGPRRSAEPVAGGIEIGADLARFLRRIVVHVRPRGRPPGSRRVEWGMGVIMDISQEIQKFRGQMPLATPEQAKEYAESISSDDDEIRDFVAKWKKIQEVEAGIKRAQYQADVDRIWSDEKGY